MNLESAKRLFESAEGRVPHLYLCSRGHVTIAVGHLVPDLEAALALNLVPHEAVSEDFRRMQSAPAGMRAPAYGPLTRSRLSEDAIDQLLDADVRRFVESLQRSIPVFDDLPEPAQLALFDMAANLGVGGLLKFRKLLDAITRRDWAECARQSHRRDISEARNQSTARLFLSC